MNAILHSFAYGLDFLREQVDEVAEQHMVAQPAGIRNHPAWVIGHLSYTCQLLGGAIGLAPWQSDEMARLFGTGSVPIADPAAYPGKTMLLAMLADAEARITRAIRALPDARLDEPFPDQLYRDVFPTIRHALTQVLVGHTAYHVGQVAIWRKAMNLPAMSRSFE